MKEVNKSEIKITPNRSLRIILIIAGWINVILGIIGAFLPLMPTTVFLLIAAACFAKSSEKFYIWLLSNRFLGKFIIDYREKGGMSARSKTYAILLLVIAISISIYSIENILWLEVLLAIIGIAVSSYILSLRTVR